MSTIEVVEEGIAESGLKYRVILVDAIINGVPAKYRQTQFWMHVPTKKCPLCGKKVETRFGEHKYSYCPFKEYLWEANIDYIIDLTEMWSQDAEWTWL